MTSRVRFCLAVAGALACLLLAAPSPAAATTAAQYKDRISKVNLRLLARYVEEGAIDHHGYLPETLDRADYPGYVWPTNPWSGKPMRAGTTRGDYVYRQLGGGTGYTLSTRLSSGRTFKLTTTPFPSLVGDMIARFENEIARRSAHLLRGYLDMWATLNDGNAPAAADVSATGLASVSNGYWPTDPFSGGIDGMTQGSGVGDFSYVRDADGTTYHLTMHLDGTDFTLDATTPQTIPNAFHYWKNELVKADVDRVAGAIDAYARTHDDGYPEATDVAAGGSVGIYLDPWPVNPYFSVAMMTQGDGAGDFSYVKTASGYTLTGHLWGGGSYVVSRP